MNSNVSPGVLLALGVVVLVIAGSYFIARKQSNGPQRRSRSPGGVARQQRGRTGELSAHDTKLEAQRLLKLRAQWPEVLTILNPTGESQIASLLQALRGPHMFVPGTALSVIIDGCDIALRKSASASALSALQEAKGSMEKVTRFGD